MPDNTTDEVKLVALKQHSYAGKQVMPGEKYTATRRHARLLVAIKGAAEDAEEAPAPGTYKTRDMTAVKPDIKQRTTKDD